MAEEKPKCECTNGPHGHERCPEHKNFGARRKTDAEWVAEIRNICFDKDIKNKAGQLMPLLRDWLLSEPGMIFLTLRDTDEILYYESGVYNRLGEKFISAWIERRMHEARCCQYMKTHLVTEVINAIIRSTYVDRSIFEESPELICMDNGILNIETNEFIPHSPDYHFLVKLPVEYDPKAECPVFDKFLAEILPGQKDRDSLTEFIGYCLYRKLPLHKSFMLVGSGSNGKSTFLGMLKTMLGDRNVACIGLQDLEGNFTLSALYGKLANIYPDLSNAAMKQTGKFKALTGGDGLTTDVKFKDHMTTTFTLKMIFSCNEIPRVISDDTDAYFRRWCVITFPAKFTKETADPLLGEKLTAKKEISGIFNKAILALGRLLKNKAFSNDDGIEAARESYIRMSDPIKAFVMDEMEDDESGRLEINPEGFIPKQELYSMYLGYCKQKGYLPKTDDGFFKFLKPHVNAQSVRKRQEKGSVWMLQGVCLRGQKDGIPKLENTNQTLEFEPNGRKNGFIREEEVEETV